MLLTQVGLFMLLVSLSLAMFAVKTISKHIMIYQINAQHQWSNWCSFGGVFLHKAVPHSYRDENRQLKK